MTDSPEGARPADIYVVGLGIVAVRQITHEAQHALEIAKTIFFLDHGFGVSDYLETLCPRVVDLFPLTYQEGERRVEAYDVMATRVLDAAMEDPPVTFAIYGHPRVYVYPTAQIAEAAKTLGLSVEVLPGISALDMILIELEIDPGFEGLQMYEATDLLVRRRPIQPDVPCLIWQPGAIESSLYTTRHSRAERFDGLVSHLRRFYDDEHPMTVVRLSDHVGIRSEVMTVPLAELGEELATASPIASLYIPPGSERPLADAELAAQLNSWTHLEKITTSRG